MCLALPEQVLSDSWCSPDVTHKLAWLMYNKLFKNTDTLSHVFNKTCEEDFGDPGSIVPYKVELADADYHRW